MTLPKRAQETLDIFNHHPGGIVSINMVGNENFALAYTFRNGVSELREHGYDIRYVKKEKGYKFVSEPKAEQLLMEAV